MNTNEIESILRKDYKKHDFLITKKTIDILNNSKVPVKTIKLFCCKPCILLILTYVDGYEDYIRAAGNYLSYIDNPLLKLPTKGLVLYDGEIIDEYF